MGLFGPPKNKQQLPPGAQPVQRGPINACPCPHCGKPNDWRDLQAQQLLDNGSTAVCDHCGGNQQVMQIQPVTMLAVRKAPHSSINRGADARPAAQATTLSPGQMRKLLK